jgi:hypothetical protein
MVPLHVEDAGSAVAIAFEGEAPGGIADAFGEIGVGRGGKRADEPARAGGTRRRACGLAEQESGDAAFRRAEREAAAGGEIEGAGVAWYLGDDGGEAGAAQPLLEDPQCVGGLAHARNDEAGRIEPVGAQATAVGQAGFGARRLLHDP